MKWTAVMVGLLVVLAGAAALLVSIVEGARAERCEKDFTRAECRTWGEDANAPVEAAARWSAVRTGSYALMGLGVLVCAGGAVPWARLRAYAAAKREAAEVQRIAHEETHRAAQTAAESQGTTKKAPDADPVRELQARLVRGEISEDEYARKRLLLDAQPGERAGWKEVVPWSLFLGLVGAFLGFLVRPSAGVLGQLPFDVVITRGATLQGLDTILRGTAEKSFNIMLAGLVIGLLLGAAVPSLQRALRRS
ncbi:MAG: hypothetical protein QOE90_3495 [Thermoplasmata archaeon]|jgi:hypothetical protein|nr:hypothetical protein [Thermoplasmata archaeon]